MTRKSTQGTPVWRCLTAPGTIAEYVMFSDRVLSRRLERAEGHACLQFARAHRRLFPDCGADWIECAGAYAVFDGVDSPVTQSFGLGLFEDLTEASLDQIEHFFFARGASANHEVSPHAGPSVPGLLCARQYRPIEISNVLYQAVQKPAGEDCGAIVRVASLGEQECWTNINARGWDHEHPEVLDFLLRTTAIAFAREGSVCFLAEIDGQTGAAGSLAASTMELPCLPVQQRFRNSADGACNARFYGSACATLSIMATSWR